MVDPSINCSAVLCITGISASLVSCESNPTSGDRGSTTSTSAGLHFESPAAPIGELSSRGKHCFRSPTDVAAAAARIAAHEQEEVRRYERARRIADAGGPLPVYGLQMIDRASDPDTDNCVVVSEYDYNEGPPEPR